MAGIISPIPIPMLLPRHHPFRSFLHGHGGFHPHELVHVLKNTHARSVIDRLLHFRRV
jgi:hypothetical protein